MAETNESPTKYNDAVLDASQFINLNIPEKKIYLAPWLKEQSITLITGWRGVGKSWFAISILRAVATNTTLGPWKCGESVNCLYLDGEMTVHDTVERLQTLGMNAPEGRFLIYSDHHANSLGIPAANLGNPQWRNAMKELLLHRSIKLWVIDNIASLSSGIDENSKQEWDPINRWLLDLRFAGISTILMHHENRTGTQRGTSAREDNIDMSIVLKKPGNYRADDGARFTVNFTKARINNAYASLISDKEFQLSKSIGDVSEWTYSDSDKNVSYDVLKKLDDGIPQKDIAQSNGITAGRVSQIKAEAIKKGWMTTAGKFTQVGFSAIER